MIEMNHCATDKDTGRSASMFLAFGVRNVSAIRPQVPLDMLGSSRYRNHSYYATDAMFRSVVTWL